MGSVGSGVAVIVLALGCFLGWHANRARAAHGDIKTTHNRISGYRRTRLRSGLIALALVLIAVFMVKALFRG
jgi:hypothetical protein